MDENLKTVSTDLLISLNWSIFIVLIVIFSSNPFKTNSVKSSFLDFESPTVGHPLAFSDQQSHIKSSGKVVFTAFTRGNWDLWIINLESSSPLQLTETPIDERTPCVSSDGSQIVYSTSDGNLWIIDPEEKVERKISLPAGQYGNPIWMGETKILCASFVFGVKDGKVNDDSSLIIFNLDKETGVDNPYVLIDQTGIQVWPSFSISRNNLIYTSSDQGPNFEVTQEIWIYDLLTRNGDQLTLLNANSMQGKFSPDGKKIVFSSDKTGNYEIWVFDLNINQSSQLTKTSFSNTEPCWSPNGNEIAFVSDRRGIKEIWRMSHDGEIIGVLSPFEGKVSCMSPCWTH